MKAEYKVTIKEPGRKAFVQYAEASSEAEAIQIIKACVLIRPGATLKAELDFTPNYIQNN